MTVVERPSSGRPPMRRPKRREPRNRVRIALLGIIVIAAGVYGIFTKRIPFVHGHRVEAVFSSANQLTPGFSPVRVAGVTVGKVVEIENGPGATSVVTMELDDDALPVRADARARIRPRLFLEGGFQVELQPGSPSAAELEDGDRIPLAQTAIPVQFHQILSSFTNPTRKELKALLVEMDRAFDDGGAEALSRTWRPLAPLLRDGALLAEAARGVRPHDASDTIRNSAKVTGALASREDDLRGLVTSLARTTTTLASRDTELAATVREIDGLLGDLPGFVDVIEAGVPSTQRFVAALRPSLRIAPPVLRGTSALLEQVDALVGRDELPALVDDLGPAVRRLPQLQTRLGRLFPLVTPVSDCVREKTVPVLNAEAPDGQLSTGRPVWQDLVHSFVGLAGAGQSFDANGFNVRYLVGLGESTVTTGNVPGTGTLAGLSENPISGARPQYLGVGVEPPYRPDVPCAESPVADLSQRDGSALGAPPSRRAARPPQRPRSVKDLRRAYRRAVRALEGARP